jgi:hypothetical protein
MEQEEEGCGGMQAGDHCRGGKGVHLTIVERLFSLIRPNSVLSTFKVVNST